MLIGALRSLESHDSPLIVSSFYWKLLALEGLTPMLESCVSCGNTDSLVAFDITEGGILCRSCRNGISITPEALHLLRRTLGGDLARVLKEAPTSVTFELEHLADVSLETHLERRIRSRHVLERH